MKGLFITFEGIEGSGKSTQLIRLAGFITGQGLPVVTTREPGGTPFGEQIRKILLSIEMKHLFPIPELFLYLASRAQHAKEVILPSLENGKIVLCDRFSDATLAYQGFGRNIPKAFLKQAVNQAACGLKPDLTFLLDLDVQKGLSRVSNRGPANRLDLEDLKFHKNVRTGYKKLAKADPHRIKILNGDKSVEAIAMRIQKEMESLLNRHKKKVAHLNTRVKRVAGE